MSRAEYLKEQIKVLVVSLCVDGKWTCESYLLKVRCVCRCEKLGRMNRWRKTPLLNLWDLVRIDTHWHWHISTLESNWANKNICINMWNNEHCLHNSHMLSVIVAHTSSHHSMCVRRVQCDSLSFSVLFTVSQGFSSWQRWSCQSVDGIWLDLFRCDTYLTDCSHCRHKSYWTWFNLRDLNTWENAGNAKRKISLNAVCVLHAHTLTHTCVSHWLCV